MKTEKSYVIWITSGLIQRPTREAAEEIAELLQRFCKDEDIQLKLNAQENPDPT